MSSPKPSPLRKLVDILSSAVQTIDDRYATANLDFPILDEPGDPANEAEHLLTSDAAITEAIASIVAAADQLSASVQFPALTIMSTTFSFHLSASLEVAASTNVVEILREAGSAGLHVIDIAKKNGSHPTKIARVLRLLATHHIFREVSPNVFTNNRLSSMMDSTKPSNILFLRPYQKHEGSSGLAAFVEVINDGSFKAAASLVESFADPKLALSEEVTATPFNLAYKTDLTFWAWLDKPENKFRRDRFGAAMRGSRKLEVPNAILKGFHWSGLPCDGVVVDVGGGIGSSSLTVAREYPGLKIFLQDVPAVMNTAREYWKAELPGAVSSGTIVFQDHDFFKPQPVANASVFLLRGVLHDWNDSQALTILRNLRHAATSRTQLLIIDQVLQYACADTTLSNAIPGAALPPPPGPLLANRGKASAWAYLIDLQMLATFNSRERLLPEFVTLAAAAGWKVVQVFHIPGSPLSHIVAEPSDCVSS